MNKKISFVIFLILFSFCSVKDQRLKYLIKDNSLANYLEIEDNTIKVYPNPHNNRKPEFVIHQDEFPVFRKMFSVLSPKEIFKNYSKGSVSNFDKASLEKIKSYEEGEKILGDSEQPLKGLKIAIDPGHFSKSLEGATVDERYNLVNLDGEEIKFFEADLTLATAKYLKSFLEHFGANVLVTREKRGESSYKMRYEDWIEDADKIKECLKERFQYNEEFKHHSLEHFYSTNCDLRNRAKIINAFHPDFSIVIHYNVDDVRMGLPTDENYSLVFVPGSFLFDELRNKMDRIQFLRLLVTNHLQDSISLAENIEKQFQNFLKVPPLPQNLNEYEMPGYVRNCIFIKDGILARNLSLTKLIHSPVAFTEVLYQNNREELINLSNLTEEIDGMKTSTRVKNASLAHFYGIVNYLADKGMISKEIQKQLLQEKF